MSISCRIFRDEQGNIDFVNTEKGSRSTLFDSLTKVAGGNKEVALTLYSLTDTALFKELVDSKKGKYKTEFLKKMKGLVKKEAAKIVPKEAAPAVAGNKLFNEPLEEASVIADEYIAEKGLNTDPIQKITKLDAENSKRIAKEFDKMKATPNDPQTKAAYQAMIDETLEQYKKILDKGYKVEINNSEPYDSSADMIKDLRDNKRMKIFSTEFGFGDEPITEKQREDNPLLQKTEFKDANGESLLANDMFRFVHDFFGHAKFGNGFGAIGEENAWNIHARMYSPLARRAMTTETRGQNSWVNFSGVNDEVFKKRDRARVLRQEGKLEEAKKLSEEVYEEMSFSEQKVGLLPEWVSTPKIESISPENSSNYANLTEDGLGNYVFYHVGEDNYKTIKRKSGATTATSREEAAALSKIGGLAMYYTRPEDSETMVSGTSKYMVKVPMDKVYDFNTDKLNLYDQAKELHDKEHPGKAFDPNSQVAYISKIAAEVGYEMVVSQWKDITRAQTTKEFAPVDVQRTTTGKVKSFTESYKSNSTKGYRSIIPVPKQTKLKEVYLEMNIERNKINKYDSIYHLYENNTKLTQDEITEMVDSSDISKELKDRYLEILNTKEDKRMSVAANKEVTANPNLPYFEVNGARVFFKDRVSPITGKDTGKIELDLLQTEARDQGQGYAKEALKKFLEYTDAIGKDVYLVVAPRNLETDAERLKELYKSFGFVETSDFEMLRKSQDVFPEDFDKNGEPSVKMVLEFSSNTPKRLANKEIAQAHNTAIAFGVKSSIELRRILEDTFVKNGVVTFDKAAMSQSGYNIYEISQIQNSPELQKQIKDAIMALRNTEDFILDYDERFASADSSEIGLFGKQIANNPYVAEIELAQELAGTEEDSVTDSLTEEMASQYAKDPRFKQAVDSMARDYRNVPVMTVENGELVEKKASIEGALKNGLIDTQNEKVSDDIDHLTYKIEPRFWDTSKNQIYAILKRLGKEAVKNGIDLQDIYLKAMTKSREQILQFFSEMETMLEQPTDENIKYFSEAYNSMFDLDTENTRLIKTNSEFEVAVDTNISEYELFDKFGLVKKQEGIYRKTKPRSLEELYNAFFTNTKLLPKEVTSVEELQEYVRKNMNKLEVQDFQVDTDNLEKMFLYKKFFKFSLATQPATIQVEGVEKITLDEEYLKKDFVQHIGKWILETQNKNFQITENGIELVNTDPISKAEAILSIPQDWKEDFAQYDNLSKKLNLGLKQEEDVQQEFDKEKENRLEAINNPNAVPKLKGEYSYIEGGVLAAKNEANNIVRTPAGIFEMSYESGNVKFFNKLTPSEGSYKTIEAEKPFSDIDYKKYTHLETTPEIFKRSKEYYSKAELKQINDDYFECQ